MSDKIETGIVAESISQPPAFGRLLRIFAPAAAIPIQSNDAATVARQYRFWQKRVLITSIIGYATFYFVRKNLSVAMPYLEHGLGIRKTQLGLFLTLHGLLYGVSKFANGFLGDRANARAFMAFGLGASALMNVFFGFNSAVVTLGLIWMANGWFQGMGFPPCARLLAHWFPPKQLASRMSIWNISHSIGGGLIVILCGYLVLISWRLAFFVPAAIAFACVIFIWLTLPDTPPSVGLPDVAGTEQHSQKHESRAEFRQFVIKQVFLNKYIWIVSLANFFVYILRYAVLDWGPTLLTEFKHVKITHATWMVAAFEFCGALPAYTFTACVAKPFVVLMMPGGPVGSDWHDWLGWPVDPAECGSAAKAPAAATISTTAKHAIDPRRRPIPPPLVFDKSTRSSWME